MWCWCKTYPNEEPVISKLYDDVMWCWCVKHIPMKNLWSLNSVMWCWSVTHVPEKDLVSLISAMGCWWVNISQKQPAICDLSCGQRWVTFIPTKNLLSLNSVLWGWWAKHIPVVCAGKVGCRGQLLGDADCQCWVCEGTWHESTWWAWICTCYSSTTIHTHKAYCNWCGDKEASKQEAEERHSRWDDHWHGSTGEEDEDDDAASW